MTKILSSLLLGALFSLGASASGLAQSLPADFNGVWQVAKPTPRLTTIAGKTPPLLPGAAAAYAKTSAQFAAGDRSFDPSSTMCKPPGEPRTQNEGMPFDITQGPARIIVGYQWNRLVRFISVGKDVSPLGPTYFGTSNAHWNGSTLVVDVTGFNNEFFLDQAGMPHSDQLHLTEWYSLADGGSILREKIRFDDPETFSAPWDTVLTYKKLPGARIAEDICEVRIGLYKG